MDFTQKTVLLWDLDGTLTDPADGIVHSVQHALRHFGLRAGREELLSFIGPPLADSFAERFGFSPEQCREAITVYRAYFCRDGKFENTPYPGIDRLLAALKAAGKRLYLASSKPEPLCEEILAHFSLRGYFDAVAGSGLDGARPRKEDVIGDLLAREGIDPRGAVMIGDRRYDAEGAAPFSIPCIGVLWGYGGREELKAAGVSAVAEDLPALGAMLGVSL